MQSNSFYVHHSTWGSYATFILGLCGRGGGFALSDVHSPDQDVFIGYAREREKPNLLPFFKGAKGGKGEEAYVVREADGAEKQVEVNVFEPGEIRRKLGWASDAWQAGDLSFRILTPWETVPELHTLSEGERRYLLAPAMVAEISLDNSRSDRPAKLLFGLSGIRRVLSDVPGSGLVGLAAGRQFAVACEPSPEVREVQHWDVVNYSFFSTPIVRRLGGQGGLLFSVPAGQKRTYTIALATFQDGIATTGLDLAFQYTKLFGRVEEVASFALANKDRYIVRAAALDAELAGSGLNEHRQFMLAHFTHSYLASSQLMHTPDGRLFWSVNEGEYRMINTFDLTVDHLFWEMRYHPWTMKNALDWYLDRYSYRDQLGLAFTHDMGVANELSPVGYSSYETPDIHGCFSYMTCEELLNWVLCAAQYGLMEGDRAWLTGHVQTLKDCLASLVARDQNGDGIMDVDSARCGSGSEITTYDSLDVSLGQARNNLYIAVKSWAAYISLEHVFDRLGLKAEAAEAGELAKVTADAVEARYDEQEGFIPAVFEGGIRSRIIPAVEALVYPRLLGDSDAVHLLGRFGGLIRVLRLHLENVLKPGVCIDAVTGGWKLSSTSENTWMSKIAISQYVAEKILHFDFGRQGEQWDAVHAGWQQVGCAEQAATDQIWSNSGKDRGSRLYPRLVTAVLWLRDW